MGIRNWFVCVGVAVSGEASCRQVGEQLPCGPDVEEHIEKIKPFLDAGFDEIALVQIGADLQKPFFE